MKLGQFWSVPLSDGRFACGAVAAVRIEDGKRERRSFLAGLVDWCGVAPPREAEISGRPLLDIAFAHIKTITTTGGEILGEITASWDIAPEMPYTDSIPTWGYNVISVAAESHFVKGKANQRVESNAGYAARNLRARLAALR